MINGKAPEVSLQVNGGEYKRPYILVDGIYPSWSTLVKTIPNPAGNKQKLFAKIQEAVRKDVERAFGVLQARFRILDTPCRLWNAETMRIVILTCIILHNMIVEDQRHTENADEYLFDADFQMPTVSPAPELTHSICWRSAVRDIHSSVLHASLQRDLIEHIWNTQGDEAEIDIN